MTAVLAPGCSTTLVHGVGHPPAQPVEIVTVLDADRVVVRLPSGAEITVPADMLHDSPPPLVGLGARATDPATSAAAADAARRTISRMHRIVLAELIRAGRRGLTDAELSERTRIPTDSASKRRGELVTMALVADSGHRRLTPRGRRAIVWVATAAGFTASITPRFAGQGRRADLDHGGSS